MASSAVQVSKCFQLILYVAYAPNGPGRAALLACNLLAFTLVPDAGAVGEQVQRPLRSTAQNVDLTSFLPARQLACIGHDPVQPIQTQLAFAETCRLIGHHTERNLHSQATLDRGIAVARPPTKYPDRRGVPNSLLDRIGSPAGLGSPRFDPGRSGYGGHHGDWHTDQ